ncbi:MAG TPA: vWA domain-containing protein [Planctomycetota bacterium]|nr:vWA domain-containing protein [Planctomycetota bacterium]
MDKTRAFHFAASWLPWYALIPVAIVAVFLAVRFYRHERAMVSGGMGRALAILRACLPVLLLLLLLEPVFSIHWSESLKGRVILLLDSSLSMAANDDRRPDDERVRLADTLGLLPDSVRDTSFQKLAARASQDAAQFPSVISAGKLIDRKTAKDAIADFKAKHRKLLKLVEDFQDDLHDFVKERNRGTIIDKPLLVMSDKLKQQIAAHQNIKPLIADLDRNPANAAGIAATVAVAYDQASADALTAAAAVLISAQQTSDSFLARSEDKAVREALAKVDQMKRSEILARLMENSDTGLMSLLRKQFYLECYKLSGREVIEIAPEKVVRDGKLAFEADGTSTDLSSGVRVAAERARYGRETSAVVLLTDGQNNAGDDPEMAAKVLAGSNLPLFTVGIGSGEPPRDIAIAELDTSRVIYLGDEVHVTLDVKYDGYQGASAPARVLEGDRVLAEKQVPFPEGRRRTPAELAFVPESVGTHKYAAMIPVQGGELIESNNRREFSVDVIDDKIRVLYVEGEPRWEYRFLKNLLLRDKTMEINRIMLTRDADELPRGSKPGQFPDTRDELFKYDVLIIGDIPADRFFPSDLKHIEAFVA